MIMLMLRMWSACDVDVGVGVQQLVLQLVVRCRDVTQDDC